jgi:hypothetical protein
MREPLLGFPLLIETVGGGGIRIQNAAWAMGAYFATLWGYVLWSLISPGALNIKRVAGIAAFTAAIGAFLVLALQTMPILSDLYAAAPVLRLGGPSGEQLIQL